MQSVYNMMTAHSQWTCGSVQEKIYDFEHLSISQKNVLIGNLNKRFPPVVYRQHCKNKANALKNLNTAFNLLHESTQHFPKCISSDEIKLEDYCLNGFGIVLTAGGEGERLRLSLQKQGINNAALKNFTKATFSLPQFYKDFGALHINLCLISSLSKKYNCHIPVVVTTGPEGSTSARVITELIDHYLNFGLKHLKILFQSERLHLTANDQIAYILRDDIPYPVTHPDETGGPIMKLKEVDPVTDKKTLDWLSEHGCHKVIVLQGTAVYNQELIPMMAAAAKSYDGLGVGIFRKNFSEEDPFGSFVALKDIDKEQLYIIEKDIRTTTTYQLKDPSENHFLPLNTGFYVLDNELLRQSSLPDYATPPKEILPHLPRSPKIGYAATDILPLAKKTAVLAIKENNYGVIKDAADLERLSKLAIDYGLKDICRNILNKL